MVDSDRIGKEENGRGAWGVPGPQQTQLIFFFYTLNKSVFVFTHLYGNGPWLNVFLLNLPDECVVRILQIYYYVLRTYQCYQDFHRALSSRTTLYKTVPGTQQIVASHVSVSRRCVVIE